LSGDKADTPCLTRAIAKNAIKIKGIQSYSGHLWKERERERERERETEEEKRG
jgi:hypothetical protein